MYFFSYTDTLATKPNPFTLNPNAPRQPSTARLTPPRSGFVQPAARANDGQSRRWTHMRPIYSPNFQFAGRRGSALTLGSMK